MDQEQQTDRVEHRTVSADVAREQEAEWLSELAASTVTLGAETGSVGVGDTVLCRGFYSTVTRVEILPIGHTHAPIRSDWPAVLVFTDNGTRSLGAPRAYIGGDLRVHWQR